MGLKPLGLAADEPLLAAEVHLMAHQAEDLLLRQVGPHQEVAVLRMGEVSKPEAAADEAEEPPPLGEVD